MEVIYKVIIYINMSDGEDIIRVHLTCLQIHSNEKRKRKPWIQTRPLEREEEKNFQKMRVRGRSDPVTEG